ncbi:MAG: MaoC/PaaZ C-terminal domain-containing protein [Hyphomicrobiaceae bacterium]
MTVNYEHLLNFPIPEVRQRVSKRDCQLYALSIGLAQDPLDERQLDFVDHHRGLCAVPSMAVVLCHPGFWLGNPATGVDAVKLVHGEQGIELFRPLPVEGELTAKTRVTGLVDKGAGKGALMYSQKELRDAASGELIAITRSTTFLRGDGGFGGPAGPVREPHVMPDGPPDIVIDLPTRAEQALIYRLNGDDNPLHSNPAIAAKAGFPRPILHGLCTLGVVTHALLRGLADYQAQTFKSLDLRFSSPVFPGETIRTEMWRDGAFRARVVERDLTVVNNGHVVFGG